jgi:hypothetical protein
MRFVSIVPDILLYGQPSKLSILALFGLLFLFLVIWMITGISPKQRYKKVKAYTKLVKNPYLEMKVRIESSGKLPVEIEAPEIKFFNRMSTRKFAIRSGSGNRFPLNLYPQTDYEFKIDFERFYLMDKTLKRYKKVKLIIWEVNGRLLSSTTIRLRLF